jgi:hyaluronoglucosaminidase
MAPELGIIEGFFGRPWSWAERTAQLPFLAANGFGFYLYAPKADRHLRRAWRRPYPSDELERLAAFARAAAASGVRLVVGLSPHEAYLDFDASARRALSGKAAQLAGAGVAGLAILFDDMRGDLPDLAARQVEIVDFVADLRGDAAMLVCPTYYSDDPVLDRVFGARPEGYLEDLGARLDPAVGLMWTGPCVCSPSIDAAHLDRLAETIGRAPVLWDNYPVNDGPRMSRRLHLRAFEGRARDLGPRIRAHGANAASQPVLSRIPLASLSEVYGTEAYDPATAFRRGALDVCGPELAGRLEADVAALQDVGLDACEQDLATLRVRYERFDHPAAKEVVAWLDGAYAIGQDELQTQ